MKAVRIISLILAIVIVLGLAATGITAFAAENTVIDDVYITVNNFAFGKSTEGITFSYPDDANYTVKSYAVEEEDGMPFSGTLGEGIYGITIIVQPNDGYVFIEDDLFWNVTGDGMTMAANWETTSDSITFFAMFDLRDMTNVITRIEATISGMEVGKPLSGVTVTAPAGANYTVSIRHISNIDFVITDLSRVIGNQFYEVVISVTPKDGYTLLDDDAEIAINGTGLLRSSASTRNTDEYDISNFFNFGTPIDKVEVTVTGMGAGKKASDVKVTVPEGAKYAVDDYYIYDWNWNDFDGTFSKGAFINDIYLVAAEGYRFTEDTAVTINGITPDYIEAYPNGDMLNTEYDLDLRTPINKVEVTVTGMEQGKKASDVKVTVPAGAKYSVDDFYIMDANWDDYVGTFDKNTFFNNIYLIPAEGYCFTDDTVATINGTEPDYFYVYENGDTLNVEYEKELRTLIEKVEVTVTGMVKGNDTSAVKATAPAGANYTVKVNVLGQDTGSFNGKMDDYNYTVEVVVYAKDGYYLDEDKTVVRYNGAEPDRTDDGDDWSDHTVMFVNKDYFFGKYIDKVDLPAWPTIKVGDEIPMPQSADNEKYSYMSVWADGDSTASSGDKFENDRLYMFEYMVLPAEGYAFAENVKVTVGGKTNTETTMNATSALVTFKSYRLGNPKVVDTIKLTGAAPTAGNAPGTVTPVADTGYKVGDIDWGVGTNGKGTNIGAPGATFQVGDYVYMGVAFQLEKDYALDLGFKIQYNGKNYSPMLEHLTIDDDGSYIAIICLGQLKKASNPDTGDATPVAMLTVLTVASILGMGVMLSRRKAI